MNKFFYLLLTLCFSIGLSAQAGDALTGLTKAKPGELGERLMLTPEVKVYDVDMQPIDMSRFFELAQSGEFAPDAYIDGAKKLKALVLRPATQEEKDAVNQHKSQDKGSANAGEAAPEFTLTDLEGNTYSNESLAGKIAVLNFWFVNCKPCVIEIPELNEVVHTYESHEDVVFIAVALDSPEKIHTFLEKHPFEYNIIPDGMKTSSSFGVSSYPTHIIIGRDGKTAYRTSGLGPTTVKDLNAKIKELL